MNTKIKFLLVGLIILLSSIGFASKSHAVIVKQDTTIIGIVSPVEWDDDDNVIVVAITVTIVPEDSTEEAYTEDYLVADTEKGNELLYRIGEKVEATGTVEIDDYKSKTIYVESYWVIKE